MKKRNSYFDALRGIAILMVVAIHTYKYSESNLELAIRQLLNCAVPFFLQYPPFTHIERPFQTSKILWHFGSIKFLKSTFQLLFGGYHSYYMIYILLGFL